MKRRIVLIVQCGCLMAGLGAATHAVAGPAAAAAAPHAYTVTMSNMSFGRLPAGLKVGDTITWVNRDNVPHTVTARDKSFDLRIGSGQSARMTLQKAGNFPFYCIYHAAMRGVLNVTAG